MLIAIDNESALNYCTTMHISQNAISHSIYSEITNKMQNRHSPLSAEQLLDMHDLFIQY